MHSNGISSFSLTVCPKGKSPQDHEDRHLYPTLPLKGINKCRPEKDYEYRKIYKSKFLHNFLFFLLLSADVHKSTINSQSILLDF